MSGVEPLPTLRLPRRLALAAAVAIALPSWLNFSTCMVPRISIVLMSVAAVLIAVAPAALVVPVCSHVLAVVSAGAR